MTERSNDWLRCNRDARPNKRASCYSLPIESVRLRFSGFDAKEKEGEAVTMPDKVHIDFDAPAILRKWPSIKNERASNTIGAYLVVEGTLDHCIRQFMAKPVSQHHLYEIQTHRRESLSAPS